MSAPVMLVVAGSRSIGAAIAKQAGEKGYDVAVNYVNNKEAAEGVAEHIRAQGRKAEIIQADLSKEDDVRRLFVEFDQHFDRLDCMVYNPGSAGGSSSVMAEVPIETLRKAHDVNLIHAMFCAAEATRRMSTKRGGNGGNMVFISSRSAEYGGAGLAIWYGSTKKAQEVMVEALSKEIAEDGIRVNCVSPGPIHTDLNDPAANPHRINWIPMRRFGKPVEVANAVLFLASDEASFITGEILKVSGGR